MSDLQQKNKLGDIINKLKSREVITYVVAGGMTTLVNFTCYHILCNILGIENMVSNSIAWVAAVIFAYVVNNCWVFRSKYISILDEIIKIVMFFAARAATFVVESAGMYYFIDVKGLERYNLIVKGCIAVIVIILNYIFSKLVIFKKTFDSKR